MKRQRILPGLLNGLLVASVLAGCSGCVDEPKPASDVPPPDLTTPSPEQVVKALTWSEMAGIRNEAAKADPYSASLSTGLATGLDLQGVTTPQLLEEIDLLPEGPTRNRRIESVVRLLLYENRFDDAARLVMRINDVETRDRLFEDMARFQVQEAFKLYRSMTHLAPEGTLPESVLTPIRHAVAAAEKIEDPLTFMECIGNIALFRGNMNDAIGVETMTRKAADSLLLRSGDGFRKAKALVLAADGFLRRDDKKTVATLVSAAEKSLDAAPDDVTAALNTALLYTEIVANYFLLDDAEAIRRTCDRTEKVVAKIVDPTQKAMALLRLADTLFLVQGKEPDIPLGDKLAKIKAGVMQADRLVRQPATEPAADGDPSVSPRFERNEESSAAWTREEIAEQKNTILRKVAVLQAWAGTLEDVWDTVEEMDHGPDRDAALTATVEMMIATRNTEFAEDWTGEISDPEKKRALLEKLKQ